MKRSRRPTPRHQAPPPPRTVVEGVRPEIDAGRFPVKRVVGDPVVVEAEVFADGHEVLCVVLLHKRDDDAPWREVRMEPLGNDRWRGAFRVEDLGRYLYTVEGWIDRFGTWARDLGRRWEGAQDVAAELAIGADIVDQAASRSAGDHAAALRGFARKLRADTDAAPRVALATGAELAAAMSQHPDRSSAARYARELVVVVERERAVYGAWYEMFPRSCSPRRGRHGTFRDLLARLPYIADMGFDVLYLPPIHPIGTTHRKGRNNQTKCRAEDPGSPWAIGGPAGGHDAVHADLGTLEDFRAVVKRSGELGLEVALDVAFQCSPDHPYVKSHPDWFRRLPDGSIRHAENPPKKYEDIYPFDFECADWAGLWEELERVVRFWIRQGIRIFRVDNPHTKPFALWERLISSVRRDVPDAIFLSEAFTRPRVMYRLAKLGFSQSYTYFAWRNTKEEIASYLRELTRMEVREYYRPNFWPSTPDILTEHLESGGRPAFVSRLVLAATLSASYGVYGPAFELVDHRRLTPEKEEYLDSEKYEVKHWDLDAPHSLRDVIARVNRIRRQNPALHRNGNVEFHPVDNPEIVCYSRRTDDGSNAVVVVANLDPHHAQSGWVHLPLEDLGLDAARPYQMHDLLSDARYLWHGTRNYVELSPKTLPVHVFAVRRRVRSERDFEYYL